MEARRHAQGLEHHDTFIATSNLSFSLRLLGRYGEAEALLRYVLESRRRILGPEHPETLIALNSLAMDVQPERRYAEATALQREALAVARWIQSPAHPMTLVGQTNLGLTLLMAGQAAEAEWRLREVLVARRRTVGPRHPVTLFAIAELADALAVAGRHAVAEALVADATRPPPGNAPGPRDVTALVLMRGRLLIALGRPGEAEPMLREVLASLRKSVPAGSSDVGIAEIALGACLAALGRPAEAEPMLLARARAARGAPSPAAILARREALDRLESLYRALGRTDQAAAGRIERLDSEFPAEPFAPSAWPRAKVVPQSPRERTHSAGRPIMQARRKAASPSRRFSSRREDRGVDLGASRVYRACRDHRGITPRVDDGAGRDGVTMDQRGPWRFLPAPSLNLAVDCQLCQSPPFGPPHPAFLNTISTSIQHAGRVPSRGSGALRLYGRPHHGSACSSRDVEETPATSCRTSATKTRTGQPSWRRSNTGGAGARSGDRGRRTPGATSRPIESRPAEFDPGCVRQSSRPLTTAPVRIRPAESHAWRPSTHSVERNAHETAGLFRGDELDGLSPLGASTQGPQSARSRPRSEPSSAMDTSRMSRGDVR
jgi:tetratricopeptide (TPR) repeat protein